MSASVPGPAGPDPAGEEADLLAAEYVLGTLDAADRASVEREAEGNPALRDAIAAWERRLAPLAAIGQAVAPPEALWSRIESSAWGVGMIGATPAAQDQTVPGRGRGAARWWQAGTAVGFALAAGLAGFAVLRPPAPRPEVTALLQLGKPGSSVFVVETTPGGGLKVTPVGNVHIAADRSLELWLLKSGAKAPRSIGLLPAGGVELAPGTVQKGVSGQILVSQEPRGGSPTGLPTGPVLWGGAI